MAGKEIYTRTFFTPQVIEDIKQMTGDCPNVYFGTPDYPIPQVACGRGCKILKGECQRMSGIQKVPESVRRAVMLIKLQKPGGII
jgi:hypothetical protein